MADPIDTFIQKWSSSGGSERTAACGVNDLNDLGPALLIHGKDWNAQAGHHAN